MTENAKESQFNKNRNKIIYNKVVNLISFAMNLSRTEINMNKI